MPAGLFVERQKRFLWLPQPIKPRPALAVPRFGKFDGVAHRFKAETDVVALDTDPLVILKAAQVDFNHRGSVLSPRRVPWWPWNRHPKSRRIGGSIAWLPSRVRHCLDRVNRLPLTAPGKPPRQQGSAPGTNKDNGALIRKVGDGVSPW